MTSSPCEIPLKVAVIATSYPPLTFGGAERSTEELCAELVERGHAVTVLCLGPAHSGVQRGTAAGVKVVRFGSSALDPFLSGGSNVTGLSKVRQHLGELIRVREYRFLDNELSRLKPDVIHINNLAGFGWMAWLTSRTAPTVQTLRDYYLSCLATTKYHDGRPCRSLVCRVLKCPFRLTRIRPSYCVGVSQRLLEILRADGVISNSKEDVVYNLPTVSGVVRQPRGGHIAIGTFGLLGRVGGDKGTWVAIEAFRQLIRRNPSRNFRLHIAGSGAAADLERLSGITAANGSIIFHGQLDASLLLAKIDALLVPTQWEEPFGRVAAEALLSGSVLIASSVGGLPEVARYFGGAFRLVSDFSNPLAWAKEMEGVANERPAVLPATRRVRSVGEAYERIYRLVIQEHEAKSRVA